VWKQWYGTVRGDIPSGAIVTVTINVTHQVGFLSNIASVASSVVDTDTTNNSVTQDTVVNRFAFDELGGGWWPRERWVRYASRCAG